MPSANVVPHQTALHGAASHGFDAFVEFLANNGADLQAKDADGRTPLDLARGGGGGGRGGAPAAAQNPKTVALLQSLIDARGGAPALPK
jgi:hypothetical protein